MKKRQNASILSTLLAVSLIGLTPTVTCTGDRAGYTWLTAAGAAGVGAAAAATLSIGQTMFATENYQALKRAKMLKKRTNREGNLGELGLARQNILKSSVLLLRNVVLASAGLLGTSGFSIFSFFSFKKSFENFRKNSN